jgi:hypothetical protein
VSVAPQIDNQEGGRGFAYAGHQQTVLVNRSVQLGRRGGVGQNLWAGGLSTGRASHGGGEKDSESHDHIQWRPLQSTSQDVADGMSDDDIGGASAPGESEEDLPIFQPRRDSRGGRLRNRRQSMGLGVAS